ncbi:DNA polymerase beta superfamily protein [Pedobacter cryoconitis]|uniref:Nucleotidyltransferase n=1 Tax=Pedobacter cryoconitis TaxID=188932 RepID=A0A7X0MJI9_9SPHI|nr:nucleotidyltransferase domain-containing protein [Pedobacter cryoconitis]MBB6501046.1 hypothetical protein [Pedobacter cryoconitis]
MTYNQLKQQKQHLLLDCISGSTAYNLNIPGSDIDKKGIFVLPQTELYGFNYQEQLSNPSQDEVYFEIGRFLDLLTKNNPNILELLNTPGEFVLYRHPLMDLVRPDEFLSKLCLDTFAGYAHNQVKKARGLNKKINKPTAGERKSIIDFCHVIYKDLSIPLADFLKEKRYSQQDCGLTNLAHFKDSYLLFHQHQLSDNSNFSGIISGPQSQDVQLSRVPKGLESLAVMNFNKDGYSTYCREYREYKDWEENRNQLRYSGTIAHGKNYDAKNMMHTFRLLNMAEEIAVNHQVIVHRKDRDFLLKIRNGEFEFDTLLKLISEKLEHITELYQSSSLPDRPDIKKTESLLVQLRSEFYEEYNYGSLSK